MLRKYHLWLPSTFSRCHRGASQSYCCSDNSVHRMDFVAIPIRYRTSTVYSYTILDADLNMSLHDHLPVFVSMHVEDSGDSGVFIRRSPIFSLNDFTKNDFKELFIYLVSTIDLSGDFDDPTSMLHLFNSSVRAILKMCYPIGRSQKRLPYISENSLELRRVKKLAWGRYKEASYYNVSVYSVEWYKAVYYDCCKKLRASLRSDFSSCVSSLAVQAQDAQDCGDLRNF